MDETLSAVPARPLRVNGGAESADVPYFSPAKMAELCTILDAVCALEDSLLSGFDPDTDLLRTAVHVPHGQVLMMPSSLGDYVGIKLVSVAPGNDRLGKPLVQAIYPLFDGATLTPVAVLDGTYLTTLRTSAVSALAARHLVRRDAERLVVFGAGAQAWAHAQSLCQVLPVRRVDVVGRDTGRRSQLVKRIQNELGVNAAAATVEAVATADVVACCTTSRSPLFPGSLLRPGTTVLAIGAFEPDARELDDETLRRGQVVVESLTSSLREAGEVIQGVAAGILTPGDLGTLAQAVRGEIDLPEISIPIFKGTGMAWQDLVVAAMIYDRARPRTGSNSSS